MSLQSIPVVTRDKENEMQLHLTWNFIEWIIEKYPEIYNEYRKVKE